MVAVDISVSIALRIGWMVTDGAVVEVTLRKGFERDIADASPIAHEAGAQASDMIGRPPACHKRDPRAFSPLVCARRTLTGRPLSLRLPERPGSSRKHSHDRRETFSGRTGGVSSLAAHRPGAHLLRRTG